MSNSGFEGLPDKREIFAFIIGDNSGIERGGHKCCKFFCREIATVSIKRFIRWKHYCSEHEPDVSTPEGKEEFFSD